MKLRILRRLYNWVLHWAESKYATGALGVHAFSESFIFPIPPDPLLMALTLSRPRRGLYYALVCSAASVIGGLIGYAIGFWAWEAVGAKIIRSLGHWEIFLALQEKFREYTFWAVMAAGFTPLPYKVFTIAAGTCSVALPPFVAGSIISRSARFFLIAGLIQVFGPTIKEKIDKYFDALAWAFLALLLAGFAVMTIFRH